MINQDPLNTNVSRWINMDCKYVASCIASAATIATFAAGVLASTYLAYKNPSKWWLTTLSVGVINLYTLPKFLRYGNTTMIQIALVTNLAALSSLSCGGISAASISLSKLMVSSFKAYQFSTTLFSAFLFTGLMGYGVPFFQGSLKKAYHFLHNAQVQGSLATLQKHFHRQPEIGLGFLQGNLWQSFILHLALFKPEFVVNICHIFNLNIPDFAWPMITVASEKKDVTHFDHMLASLENLANELVLEEEQLSDEAKENYYLGLKLAMQSLQPKDVSQAIALLISRGDKIIPTILSHAQFLQLFQEDVLNATNDFIQTFVSLMDKWDDLTDQHQMLSAEITQLEQDIQNVSPNQVFEEEKDDLNQRYENIHQEYSELRKEVEKIYSKKRIWQNVISLWDNETDLPFDNIEALLKILQDANLLKNVDDIYRSLVGTGQGANQTLLDQLQHIKNKLTTLCADDTEEEEISSIMYLAANKGFVQQDFHDLQEWLDLDSPHGLEEAMANIGLATEEELYEKDILPRQGQISKATIRDKLFNYIKQAPKPLLANRVQTEEEIQQKSLLGRVREKVIRVVCHAIISGLLLAPVLLRPAAGGAGFVLGSCFFTLKRFGFSGTQTIADVVADAINSLPLGNSIHSLLNRRIFSYHRETINYFVEAGFFSRMRLINLHILAALFISSFHISSDDFFGSFCQGLALGNQVVELF